METNLHPLWQVKFAHIIVLLIKELDISIYVNSHSPQFIEAIEVFSNYYDLKDETYYYLTKLNKTGFEFKFIANDDLYELYDNLSKPYRYMEGYRRKSRK